VLRTKRKKLSIGFSPCIPRTGFKLWQDGEMTLDDRKEVIRRLKSALYSLKNSVEKYGNDGVEFKSHRALDGRNSEKESG